MGLLGCKRPLPAHVPFVTQCPEDQMAPSIAYRWDRLSRLSLSLCASNPLLPGAPLFPQNSGFGKFPVCASSDGTGHRESWLRDVLAFPGPTSPARLVLVTQFHVAA